MRYVAHFIFFIMLGVSAAVAAPDARVTDILARSKAAAGGPAWDAVRFVRTKMTIETSGLKGTGESLDDAQTGAYADTYDLGSFKGASGYDGSVVWEQDTSGEVAVQGAAEAREGAANEAYRRSRAFWYPARATAEISYVRLVEEGPRKFHVLRFVPQGGRPFDMWVDAATYLIDRAAEQTARELRTTFFSDYRAVDGKRIAFASRQTNGIAKYDTRTAITHLSFETDVPKTAFAPPPPPKRDFGLARGSSTTIPFKLINNHIYMEVRLNGRPYEFLFDTGGLNVITPTVAKELGLKAEGAVQTQGVGEKSEDAGFTTVSRMEVGAAWLERQTFVVLPLESFSSIEGRPITGIVGYEIFKRFVVETDYENGRVTLIEPKDFVYRGPGIRVAMTLNERIPEVDGDIDGIPGKFTLDTGSRSTLDLSTPFVQKHNLVARFGAKYQGVTGWGVGGPVRSWIVRAKRFAMGGAVVDQPVVELSQTKSGAMSDAYVAGNVGAGVLAKFNIVWDYPRHQVFFAKNRNYEKRDVFDRAGFWANENGNTFEVIDVIAGAPAEAAGLKLGDRILVVNGKKAVSALPLPDLRLLKKAPPGTNLILDVDRKGQRLTINILLKDLI